MMKRLFLALVACSAHMLAAGAALQPTRGVVVSAADLSGQVDWPKMAHEAGIGTIATHIGPKDVMPFMASEAGKRFVADCAKYGIAVEHELHAIEYLLPRTLFDARPHLFRMDEKGRRTSDANCCASSAEALAIVASNAVEVAKVCRSTTGRYFYWMTDDAPICACPDCSLLSAADQATRIENAIVRALRQKIDPNATLSHLAYLRTLEAPRRVKPDPALFLEFAPIRRWSGTTRRENLVEGGEYARILDELLAVFPAETAQVLEYWLDESLFSDWKANVRTPIPWDVARTRADLLFYAQRGIRNFTTFAVSVDDLYLSRFGETWPRPLREYATLVNAMTRLDQTGGVSFAQEATTRLVRLANRFGRLEVSLKGAQIRSFKTADGAELLYRPAAMDFSGTTENRGGIPLCWPWFGRNGEPGTASHGFARYSDFSLQDVTQAADGSLTLTLALDASERTLALWPFRFHLEYRITLGDTLTLELETFNVGDKPMLVTKGLHPYWAVSNRRDVTVRGLDGLRYCFADETTVDNKVWQGDFVPDGHFDHVFRLTDRKATLTDAGTGRTLRLGGDGFSKYVIWTPAPFADGAFENVAARDFDRFVCLEPAILFRDEAITIPPGASHTLRFTVSAEKK